jgi:foldase protein PrsA
MKSSVSLVVIALFVTLLASACGGGGGTATLKPGDVAVVGGQTVTSGDLDAVMNVARASYKAQKRQFPKPGTQAYETVKSQAVTLLVQRAEYAQKAQDLGIHISDKQIDAGIEQVKKQFYGGSEAKYEQGLKAQGLSPNEARQFEKSNLTSKALADKITGDVHVSDKDIEQYYNQNKATLYAQKESRDIRHILVKTKALADLVYAKLVAAHEKNFAALAKKYSKDPGSAANGGKLTISRGQTVPPFDKTAFSLATGQLSKPVKTQFGWHVIQALSPIRPATTMPLSKVKNQIRQTLEQQKKNSVSRTWIQDTAKEFCKPGKVKYEPGFAPNPDPCLSITASTPST